MQPSCSKTRLDFSAVGFIPLRHARFSAIPLSVSVGNTDYPNNMGILGGFGSTLVGCLVSTMLYGTTTLQTYVYYMHNSEDESTTKFIVAAIWVLDTLHVSFMCHVEYYYLVTNWGVPTSLEYIVWTLPASALVDVTVITIVRIFFIRTIYCLCRRQLRWLVIVPIVLLVLVHIGCAMAAAIVMFNNSATSFASYTRFYTLTPAACAVALAEVLITMSLCILLHESGSHSVVPRTKRLLTSLIFYAVNRCLLTLPVVIAVAVMDAANMVVWSAASGFIVGKLYVNSLLALLNTRKHLQHRTFGPESNLYMSTVRFAGPPKLSVDVGSPKEEVRQLTQCKVAVINTTTKLAFDETT
ncbi:hypothetical protein EDD17DRAFT_1873426 [Pisolithus thermaeus]|nr:hypothetical protein EDD17DRAFT_1873426 [Pisolithus thermaeus]